MEPPEAAQVPSAALRLRGHRPRGGPIEGARAGGPGETMDPPEAAQVPSAALRLREHRLRGVPIEVERPRYHCRPRQWGGKAWADLSQLAPGAGDQDICRARAAELRRPELHVLFIGEVKGDHALRRRL